MRHRALVPIGAIPLFLAILMAVRPGAFGEGAYVNVYNASIAASALVVAIGAWHWRPKPLLPWVLIAATLALWVIGDVVYAVLGTSPTVSMADVFFIAGYATFIGGGVRLVRAGIDQRDTDSLIDVAIVFVAAVYGAWALVIEPSWAQSDISTAGRYVVASYPVFDAGLLVLIAALLFGRRRPTASNALLALGISIVFAGDIVYAILQQTGSYVEWALLDASWPLGYALLALAALHPSVAAPRRSVDPGMKRRGASQLLAAAVALLAVPAVGAAGDALNDHLHSVPFLAASTLVVALVAWRLLRLQRQVQNTAAELERSVRYFRGLATKSSDAFVVISGDGIVVDASPELAGLVGWSRDFVVGMDTLVQATDLVHDDDRDLALAFLARAQQPTDGEPVMVELRARRPDGTLMWIEAYATNLLDDPAVQGIVLNIHDISARKRAEAELARQAFHDALTGLANHALLRDRIGQALARSTRRAEGVAVLLCDLDGLKTVNDTLGRDAGDELLRVAAARLLSAARAEDTVARIGGDEFAAVIEGGTDLLDGAITLAGRMLQVLSDPVEIAGTPMVVTASVGIALSPPSDAAEHEPAADALLREADLAMHKAKSFGSNRHAVYDRSMSSTAINSLSLTRELLQACERNEFVLHYQPIIELNNEHVTGFEALIRWRHPSRGLVPPLDFIPIAESSNLIVDIGGWVLREACAVAAAWPSPDGSKPLTIAVNVSGRQLDSDQLLDDAMRALTLSGLEPDRLVLEITESALIARPDAVAKRLTQLKKLGIRISIDDFGTGYSSLSYLRRFPIDILKIDRSFVETIDDANRLPAIIRGLLELGRTLNLEMIAEGIERPEQHAALALGGCQLGQGFLFSQPVSKEDTMRIVDRAVGQAQGSVLG